MAASETTDRMQVCDRMIAFPDHALLIVEERLREQQTEGVQMPDRMPLDELTRRVLIAAELAYGP